VAWVLAETIDGHHRRVGHVQEAQSTVDDHAEDMRAGHNVEVGPLHRAPVAEEHHSDRNR
jgi:hypothetical protein